MAAIPIIGDIVGKVLDRVIPDKAANDAAKAQLAQMALKGELDEVAGQLQVDANEASNPSVWTSGARPAILWVCAAALAMDFLVRPLTVWVCNLAHHPADFPVLDMTELWPLISAMLGLAGAHAYENIKTSQAGK